MTKELVSKLSLTNFNPKAIHGQPETTRELMLGSIIGIANGVKKGFQADGVTPYEGLKGNFEAVMVNADGEVSKTIGSGVCYLPDAFMGPILDQLSDEVDADGNVTRAAATSIQFSYLVKVIRADNPAGYSWGIVPVGEATQNDPLASLRSQVTAPDAQKLLSAKPAATIEGTGKAPKAKETPAA